MPLNHPDSTSSNNPERPNIIFIMTDDHASKAISAYDGSLNHTPNLDRLAEEGLRFEHCYCTNAICAPSRAVILTGKHSHITGHIDNNKAFDGSQQTFPKLLQKAGYQTAMVGKWHLISEPTGFDYWIVLPGQGSYYNPDFIEMGERKRVDGYVTDLITDYAIDWLDRRDKSKNFCLMLHHKAPHRNWMPPAKYLDLYKDRDIPEPANLFDDYATRSRAMIEQQITIEKDLFQDYDFKVHYTGDTSHLTDEEKVWKKFWEQDYGRMDEEQRQIWDEAYAEENEAFLKANLQGKDLLRWKYQRYMKDYLRTIASVDENIGRVLDYLKENNLEQNTVVVYTSDQGFFLGEHGFFDKRFMYDESLKMPFIVRYPKEIQPGVNDTDLVQNLDFAPTFLDYAGVDAPSDMQGESIRGILKGKTPAGWRDVIYHHFYEFPAIGMVKRHYGIRTLRYKLIHFYYDIDEWEMYDLLKDPHEMNNIYDDPAFAEVRREMESKLEQVREQYGDTNEQQFLPKPPVQVKHAAIGCPVTLKYPCSERYDGGDLNALTDGWRAPEEVNTSDDHKVWQGFEQDDLDAVIDLKKEMTIHSICAGFLQQIDVWIFMPVSVTFEVSSDGWNFRELTTVQNTFSEQMPQTTRHEFTWNGEEAGVRFVRVFAKNRGVCPNWHPGAGEKAWVFADEVCID